MNAPLLVSTLLASLALLGCGGSRRASGFPQIAPGMTSQQVYDLMGSGPTQAREFKDGSVAWFYGNNACVRIREDLVVGKELTEQATTVHTPWGGVSQRRVAQCAPPDEAVDSTRTDVYTPIGTFSAPNRPASGAK